MISASGFLSRLFGKKHIIINPYTAMGDYRRPK